MPSLHPVSRLELIRKLKGLGFEGPFPGGKHQWMRRSGLRVTIPIPTAAQSTPVSFAESSVRRGSPLMNGPMHELGNVVVRAPVRITSDKCLDAERASPDLPRCGRSGPRRASSGNCRPGRGSESNSGDRRWREFSTPPSTPFSPSPDLANLENRETSGVLYPFRFASPSPRGTLL